MQYEKDMVSPYKDLFLAAREVILAFDVIEETQKERITTYGVPGGGICHMRTTKTGVDVGLLKGTLLQDSGNHLTGKSKKMRVYSFNALDRDILSDYIGQSIDLLIPA